MPGVPRETSVSGVVPMGEDRQEPRRLRRPVASRNRRGRPRARDTGGPAAGPGPGQRAAARKEAHHKITRLPAITAGLKCDRRVVACGQRGFDNRAIIAARRRGRGHVVAVAAHQPPSASTDPPPTAASTLPHQAPRTHRPGHRPYDDRADDCSGQVPDQHQPARGPSRAQHAATRNRRHLLPLPQDGDQVNGLWAAGAAFPAGPDPPGASITALSTTVPPNATRSPAHGLSSKALPPRRPTKKAYSAQITAALRSR